MLLYYFPPVAIWEMYIGLKKIFGTNNSEKATNSSLYEEGVAFKGPLWPPVILEF